MSEAAAQALDQLEKKAQGTVTISALHGGTFTLPLKLFIADAQETDRSLVPSLAFLLVHQDQSGHRTNIVFDLGLRRETDDYIPPIRDHLHSRQPVNTLPDVRQSLAEGGVRPADVSQIIISHVHWDHTGTPADYPQAQFWVGGGALDVLEHGLGGHLGHQHFESKLFHGLNVEEFPGVPRDASGGGGGWDKVGDFWMRDFRGDGTIYVVDAPGHLPGHVNLLARMGRERWVYLVGDACHDRRLLTGEKEIAEWTDPGGRSCCIHTDKKEAEATLARIRDLQAAAGRTGFHLEVILAHSMEWSDANRGAFLPGAIASS